MFKSKSRDPEIPKSNFWAIVVGVGLLGIFIAFAMDNPVAGEIVEAKIVGVHQYQSEVPKPPVLIAELPSGQRTLLAGSQRVARRINALARIQRYETRVMGRVYYRFIAYIDI